jgi:hypothetical protein
VFALLLILGLISLCALQAARAMGAALREDVKRPTTDETTYRLDDNALIEPTAYGGEDEWAVTPQDAAA